MANWLRMHLLEADIWLSLGTMSWMEYDHTFKKKYLYISFQGWRQAAMVKKEMKNEIHCD